MRLTVNKIATNGAVNAIVEYSSEDWCIIPFPSMDALNEFATEHDGIVAYTPEVTAQLEAINAPASPPPPS